MLRELLALFGPEQEEQAVVSDLDLMIQNSAELVRLAGDACFQRSEGASTLDQVKRADKDINKLQRKIRKEAFVEVLSDSNRFSLPFCLSIMNVVKDVERIGDYAKDITALAELSGPVSVTRDLTQDFSISVGEVERLTAALPEALQEADQLKAVHLIERGKDIRRDLGKIQRTLLTEEQTNVRAAADTLAVQYYVRIVSHALNVLSTIVTPLHRMDYTRKKDLLPEVREKLKASAEPSGA